MAYRIATFLIAAVFATAAVSGKVYRWEDDSGQLHYGQQPPKGVDAEPVNPNVSPANPGGDKGSDTGDEQAAAEGSKDELMGEVDEEYVRKQCKKARKGLKNLKEHGPDARYANENDEIVKYSKEEYQKRLEQNRKFKERFCDDKAGSDGASGG